MKKNILLFICTASLAVAAGNATAGKAVYDRACKSCHGADGTPNAAIAKMMKVDMKSLGSAEVQKMSDAEIKGVVTGGKGKMKPVASVKGAEADDVVAYIRTLKK